LTLLTAIVALCCCGHVNGQDTAKVTNPDSSAIIQYGTASFYGGKFHGKKTASGEVFDKTKLTGAHNGLPLGTWVKVTNLKNKRTVVVKITDRMSPKNKRLIDLSRAAAEKLGYISAGLTKVKVEVLGKNPPPDVGK